MTYQKEWEFWHAGAIIADLFERLRPLEQHNFCHHMTRAALDLLVLGLQLNEGLGNKSMMLVHREPRSRWHVARPGKKGLRVRLAVPINDSVLWSLSQTRAGDSLMIIVPPRMGYVVDHALCDMRKDRLLNVRSLDDYVAYRTTMSGLDAGWSAREATIWLLRRYNLYSARARTLHSPVIDGLPNDASLTPSASATPPHQKPPPDA